MKRWLSKIFSASHLGRPRTTQTKRRQPPLALERLEDRLVPTLSISLQEAGVNGGAPTVVSTGADFTAASFSGTYGDFKVTIFGGASDNGATLSDLLSSTVSVQNIGASTATLNLAVFQDNYTLPTGSPLVVESGLGGSVNAGTLSLSNIFQASASSTNDTTFDFTNGPQTATPNGSTFQTGSVTGLFNRTPGNPYALSSTAAINLSAGGQINYSTQVNVTAAPNPEIAIVKLTNGTNNDSPPVAGTPDGPIVPVGGAVTWTYDVTDPGNEPIANVAVTDSIAGVNPQPVLSGGFNVGDTNHNGILDPGETWVFTASGTAIAGQYSNIGTATGTSTITDTPVTASNPDHYFGATPAVQIVKLTNGTNNDSPPVTGVPDGPIVAVGSTVTWTYDVTNPSSDPFSLSMVQVTDNIPGVNPQPVLSGGFNVGDTNDNGILDPGETWVFTASGTAVAGQYSNIGTVVATPVSSTERYLPGRAGTVTASNPDHYFRGDPDRPSAWKRHHRHDRASGPTRTARASSTVSTAAGIRRPWATGWPPTSPTFSAVSRARRTPRSRPPSRRPRATWAGCKATLTHRHSRWPWRSTRPTRRSVADPPPWVRASRSSPAAPAPKASTWAPTARRSAWRTTPRLASWTT